MLSFLSVIANVNDQDRVTEIYQKYHDIMYKAALSKLSGGTNAENNAEDAVQSAFIKIINHLQSICFNECEERLRAYFVTIAINEALNILKHNQSVSLDEIMDNLPEDIISDNDFVDELCMRDEYDRLKRALLKLNDHYRTVLFLYFVEEKKGSEIAELLDMNVSTVHTTIQRGKALLLEMLKGES